LLSLKNGPQQLKKMQIVYLKIYNMSFKTYTKQVHYHCIAKDTPAMSYRFFL